MRNLYNLVVRPDGTVNFVLTSNRVRLWEDRSSPCDQNGSTLVIHCGEDYHETNPTGNSGARVRYNVIQG